MSIIVSQKLFYVFKAYLLMFHHFVWITFSRLHSHLQHHNFELQIGIFSTFEERMKHQPSSDVQVWTLTYFSVASCLHRNGETSMKGSLHNIGLCVHILGPLRLKLITEILLAIICNVSIRFWSHAVIFSYIIIQYSCAYSLTIKTRRMCRKRLFNTNFNSNK